MIKKKCALLVLFSGLLFSQDGIVFLHLRLKDNTISLLESNVRPGTLKESRAVNNDIGISLEVLSENGSPIFVNTVNDPSIQHYEYEDPNSSQRLIKKEVIQNDVEFFLRVPYFKDMRRIRFYRTTLLPAQTKSQRLNRLLLGTIELYLQGKQ